MKQSELAQRQTSLAKYFSVVRNIKIALYTGKCAVCLLKYIELKHNEDAFVFALHNHNNFYK